MTPAAREAYEVAARAYGHDTTHDTTGIDDTGLALVHTIRYRRLYWWISDDSDAECQRLLQPVASFQAAENRAGWENDRTTTERQPKAAAAFREYLTACGVYLHRIGFDLEDIPQPGEEIAG